MKVVKKVEIVTDSLELKSILKILETIGVSGYTIMKDVTGRGERGVRGGDELTDVFSNSYVMIACTEEQTQEIVDAIRPILSRFGGVCLVSDAQWVDH